MAFRMQGSFGYFFLGFSGIFSHVRVWILNELHYLTLDARSSFAKF